MMYHLRCLFRKTFWLNGMQYRITIIRLNILCYNVGSFPMWGQFTPGMSRIIQPNQVFHIVSDVFDLFVILSFLMLMSMFLILLTELERKLQFPVDRRSILCWGAGRGTGGFSRTREEYMNWQSGFTSMHKEERGVSSAAVYTSIIRQLFCP